MDRDELWTIEQGLRGKLKDVAMARCLPHIVKRTRASRHDRSPGSSSRTVDAAACAALRGLEAKPPRHCRPRAEPADYGIDLPGNERCRFSRDKRH